MKGTPDGWEVVKYAVLTVLLLLACIAFIWLAARVVAGSY
jgi:hypothetical protein